jgi:hypothetical protein
MNLKRKFNLTKLIRFLLKIQFIPVTRDTDGSYRYSFFSWRLLTTRVAENL